MSTQQNPTLIPGFEDIMRHIKNQEEQIKKLEDKNNVLQDHIGEFYQENQNLSAGMDKILSQFKERQEENNQLKKEIKHSDNYWRCIMDNLSNPDNPDVNFIKSWASEDGLNEEDTEELLNKFGYYPEEEDPTDM